MPASIKLQQEHGDDLQVVFVESQGADMSTSEAFAWSRKWMGTRAMWTTERPLHVEGRSLPKFALLGVNGELLLSGNPLAQKGAIEEAIEQQIKLARRAPEGTPRELARAWTSFLKGDVGQAIAACDALSAEDELAAPAAALRAEMVARTSSRLARARWLADNGHVDEAMDQLSALAAATKGCAEFDEPIAEQLARLLLPDEGLANETEATRALASVESRMFKGKPFEGRNLKGLEKVREQYPDTHAGRRAAHLIELAKLDL